MKKRLILFNVITNAIVLLLMLGLGFLVTESNYKDITQRKVIDVTEIYAANYSNELIIPEGETRVTIIDSEGNVIKDSQSSEIGENHLNREEIISAKSGNPKVVIRYSESLKKDMMYYAKMINSEGNNIFVRAAVPMESINAYLIKSIWPMLLILLGTLIASIIASVLLSNFVLKPLFQVKESLKEIEKGNYTSIPLDSKDKSINAIIHDINVISQKINDSNLVRQEFFANASHELKNPFKKIRGFNELICLNSQEPETVKYATNALKETDRAIALIGNMLELSKIESFKIDRDSMTSVNVRSVVEEIRSNLDKAINDKHISFIINGDGVVLANYDHIYAVMENLIENAVKYNNPNGLVEVNISKENGKLRISVHDTGIGISDEDQKHVFERFYRVDKSRSRETGGTGLGLSIVKHILELYNAEIDITSKLHEGTTFVIYFR